MNGLWKNINLTFLIILITISPDKGMLAQLNSPDELYGELFTEVQTRKVFDDYKTFADCIPLEEANVIVEAYHKEKNNPDFQLKAFVLRYFLLPDTTYAEFTSDTNVAITDHINKLWDILTKRSAVTPRQSSVIRLPYPYVVPGGRFREMFYWDSYFIMEGLALSGRYDLLQGMLGNFAFLIDSFGYIPNGNRTYFLSRSQPPFFASMVALVAENDVSKWGEYLPYLEREYQFWMNGTGELKKKNSAFKRVVRLNDGEILNRYWDDHDRPRAEGYGKEVILSEGMEKPQSSRMYKSIRAACESGWDFSSRWFKDDTSIKSTYTVDLIPVDLNCLLYFLEQSIAKGYEVKGDARKTQEYLAIAMKRKKAILKYCWNNEAGFFMDYDLVLKKNTSCYSLAGAFPLYFKVATNSQAALVAAKLEDSFLMPGGFVTTLRRSNYQWDAPNGWAPLQLITVIGLLNYGFETLALNGARRWVELNERVYSNTGKLLEKYNVVDMNLLTGGGEYKLQDGFGWTNGVYLKLRKIIDSRR